MFRGMRISPHHNLTITILRRNRFSDLRLRAASPRRVVRADHVHAADRARLAPPIDHCRASSRGFPWEGSFPNDPPCRQSVVQPDGQSQKLGGIIDVYA
jgi:hypothetical protein